MGVGVGGWMGVGGLNVFICVCTYVCVYVCVCVGVWVGVGVVCGWHVCVYGMCMG